MKSLLTALVLSLTTPFALGATMLYKQSFENPIELSPEIQWITTGYPVTQALVTHMPADGEKSVRGNFNPLLKDPITNMTGVTFTQFKINFSKIDKLKNWYPTTEKIYVSWKFKLDECYWKGTDYDNTDPYRVSGKFAYLKMKEDPATSYYFTMNGGSAGSAALSANSWNNLWEQWYGRSALWLANGTQWGADGKWHKLSFFIGKRADGQKYIMWWIDDKLMKADKYEVDGKMKIYNGFVLDSIQFWHSKNTEMDKSIDPNPNDDQYCNGWQVDDFQVWDDISNQPLPPTPLAPSNP